MLYEGKIHAARLTGRDAGAAAITDWLTRQVSINLRTPEGVNVFDYHPGDLAYVASHESEHLDQVAGMSWWQRFKFAVRYNFNPAFKDLIEADAHQYGCNSARGDFGYTQLCANVN